MNTYILLDEIDYKGRKLRVTAKEEWKTDPDKVTVSVEYDAIPERIVFYKDILAKMIDYRKEVRRGVEDCLSRITNDLKVIDLVQLIKSDDLDQVFLLTRQAASGAPAGVSMASHPKETEVFSSGDLRITARHVGDCLQFHFDASFAQTAVSFTHAELRYLRFPEDTVRDKIVATVGSGFGSQHPTTILVEQTLTDDVLLDVIEQGLPKKGNAKVQLPISIQQTSPGNYELFLDGKKKKVFGDETKEETCPDCGGTGEIHLFISTVPCDRCRV